MADDGRTRARQGERRGLGGLKIAKLFGIELRLDPSLLVIFVLIVLSLGAGLFPAWHPDWGALLNWGVAVVAAILFLASIVVHELAHSLVAKSKGMEVRSITMFLFGGVSNIEQEPPSARVEFLMAIVGPLTSIGLGILFMVLASAIAAPAAEGVPPAQIMAQLGPVPTLLAWLGWINVLVGIFNLIPGFPLDGGRVLRSILWGITKDLEKATRWAAGVGRLVGWTFVVIGVAMAFGITVPVLGTGIVGGLWIAFIGWFLTRAAAASYQQVVLENLLGDVSVRDVMSGDAVAVSPDMPLDELVDDYFTRREQRAYPVAEGDRWVGLVCLDDVRKVGREERSRMRVRDVMTPRDRVSAVNPDTPAVDALQQLASRNVGQLPVEEQGRLQGLVRREDIMRWLELHTRWQGRPA